METQQIDHEYITNNVHPIFERLVVDLLIEKPSDPVAHILEWLKTKGRTLYKLPEKDTQLASQKENRNYITTKIHPIFERLIVDLLLNKPQDVLIYMGISNIIQYSFYLLILIPHMNEWFLGKGSQFCLALENAFSENKTLDKIMIKKKPKNEEHISSESDEDQDLGDELPILTIQQKHGNYRNSVSAEVVGYYNQKQDYEPPIFKKKQDQRERINKRLQHAFMFQNLDDKQKEIIINAMEEKKYRQGDWVIRQGESGLELFIIDSGELDCFKQVTKSDLKFMKTFMPGESFGELALLYTAPRAASIRAKTDCVLWSLDRDTFNHIVQEAAIKKREKYEKFLGNIELLKEIDPDERSKISDALRQIKTKKGEYVVRQGDEGDRFFMIEEGELVALKVTQPGAEPIEVMQYKPGMYFGELALMKDQPRQASVLCKTDCTLVFLDRYSFKRLLGPLDNILKRNMEQYNKFK